MSNYLFLIFFLAFMVMFFLIDFFSIKRKLCLPWSGGALGLCFVFLMISKIVSLENKILLSGLLLLLFIHLLRNIFLLNASNTSLFFNILLFYPIFLLLQSRDIIESFFLLDIISILLLLTTFFDSDKKGIDRFLIRKEIFFSLLSWFGIWCFFVSTKNIEMENIIIENEVLFFLACLMFFIRLVRVFNLFPFDSNESDIYQLKSFFKYINYIFIQRMIIGYFLILTLQNFLVELEPQYQLALDKILSCALGLSSIQVILKILGEKEISKKNKYIINSLWYPLLLAIWLDGSTNFILSFILALFSTMIITSLIAYFTFELQKLSHKSFNFLEHMPIFSACYIIALLSALGLPRLGPLHYRMLFVGHLIEFSNIWVFISLVCVSGIAILGSMSSFIKLNLSLDPDTEHSNDKITIMYIIMLMLIVGFFNINYLSNILEKHL